MLLFGAMLSSHARHYSTDLLWLWHELQTVVSSVVVARHLTCRPVVCQETTDEEE